MVTRWKYELTCIKERVKEHLCVTSAIKPCDNFNAIETS